MKHFILPLFILIGTHLSSQPSPTSFTLEELMSLAVTEALDIKQAKMQFEGQNLSWLDFQYGLQPRIYLTGTFPNLNRSIVDVPLPNGQEAFASRSTMNNRLGVELGYQIKGTGGYVYFSSSLNRLDVFKTSAYPYSKNYFYTPFSVGINQPLFQFNEIKYREQQQMWLNHELSMEQAVIREEVIARLAILYGDLYGLQLQESLARQSNSDLQTLINIKQALFNTGSGSKVEMLRLQNQRNQKIADMQHLQQQQSDMRVEIADLCGLNRELDFRLAEPAVTTIDINHDLALQAALKNDYQTLKNQRAIWEAEANISRARKNTGIDMNLNATVGANKSGENLDNLFQDLLDKEIFSLSLRVPLTGWKSRDTKVKIAENDVEITRLQIQDEQQSISRELTVMINQHQWYQSTLARNLESKDIATEIYQLTVEEYQNGTVNLNTLLQVQAELVSATLQYDQTRLSLLKNYYRIRSLCLFDFETGKDLVN